MLKRMALSLGVLMLSWSVASAGVIANTATVLPAKTFSVTGGVTANLNPFGGYSFFAMAGMGLGSKLDLNLKYMYQDWLGLDLEMNLIKSAIALSADLGVNYQFNSSVFGISLNLLASKNFKGIEPYIALEDVISLAGGGVANALDAYVGVDIKLYKGLSLIVEFDLPVLGYGPAWSPSAMLGLCWYMGDSLDL